MQKITVLFWTAIMVVLISGCSVSLPSTAYSPQNLVRISGEVSIGEVRYLPYLNKQVSSPGQIRNTGPMTISRQDNISDLVKKAIILEMEQSGVKVKEGANYIVSTDIIDLYASDVGTTIDIGIVLNFAIRNKAGEIIYDKKCIPSPAIFDKNIWSAPQMDYNTPLATAISQAFTIFIQDPKVQTTIRK